MAVSLADSLAFMKSQRPLHVLPKFVPETYALFMNRFTEVAWTVHRLLPAIQPLEAPMPKEWAERWTLVDESFEIAVPALSKDLGKKVGDAYADFVKMKFPFTPSMVFPL